MLSSSRLLTTTLTLCLAIYQTATGAAQPVAPSANGPAGLVPTSGQPLAGPAPSDDSPLDTYYLRDSKGQLVPVPGFTYEEFEQLLRLKRGLTPPPPPSYSLDAVTASGTVAAAVANLQLTATIRVRSEGWVRVPLSLGQAILRQPPRYEGPGEHVLTADASVGYLLWLKGADPKPHVVTFQLSVPTVQAGAETRLALSLPRATESSLRLAVPGGRAEAALLGGEGIVSVSPAPDQKSEISVLGPSGELHLAWQAGREPAVAGPAVLEASGEILVKVEGESRISSDARLRIRSLGAAVDAFRVRLPPGMELVPSNPNGYSAEVVELTPSEAAKLPGVQVVEIKLPRPVVGVAEVRLLAAMAADRGLAQNLTPGRFDVEGAVRQRGTIDCTVDGEWLLQWKEDGSVRRLDVGADVTAARLAARYEYSRQPCGLSLKVSTRPSRVNVEPTHVLYIDAQQVRIESTLKYRFRGARVAGLDFDLADWKLDRITPADLLEIVSAPAAGQDRVTVPVLAGVALPAEFELKLEAHQTFDATRGNLSLVLPHPVADVVAPATVIVAPADNIELTPQPARMQGLSPDASSALLRIPGRQQAPLAYRDLGGGETAVFAADLLVRSQSLTAGARATVRLDGALMLIEQRLDYRIAYEPRRSLEILVPRAVLQTGRLEVLLADEPLLPTPVADAPPVDDSVRLAVACPSDQIGLCQLLCRYVLPLPEWDRQQELKLKVPLVIPADLPNLQIGGQQIEFILTEGWQLAPDAEGSSEFSHPTPTGTPGQSLSFAWSKATSVSNWKVQPLQTAPTVAASIRKTWLQTWLAGGVRQDRAVFRLTTDQPQLRVRLPSGPNPGSVQAAINARPAALAVREPATLVVEVPPALRGVECVVEVWYATTAPEAGGGFLAASLRPPLVEGAGPSRRLYWQLFLPEDEHLLVNPAEFSAEMTWGHTGWLWGRRPAQGQQELEGWIGASRQDTLPRGVNAYLFSAVGRTPSLSFAAASRRLLLFGASGIALVAGLVLLHVPAVRRPETLLVVAIVLAALALAWPDTSALLAQAAVLGLGIVAVFAVGLWLSAGRTLWSIPPSQVFISAPPEGRSTESPAGLAERLTPLTTATAPAGLAPAEQHP